MEKQERNRRMDKQTNVKNVHDTYIIGFINKYTSNFLITDIVVITLSSFHLSFIEANCRKDGETWSFPKIMALYCHSLLEIVMSIKHP